MISSQVTSAVFVVDDDASVRDSVQSLLKSVGFHVEVFASTEEFMQAARPDVPSCLVLDVRLPGVNGLDFQEQMGRAGGGPAHYFYYWSRGYHHDAASHEGGRG